MQNLQVQGTKDYISLNQQVRLNRRMLVLLSWEDILFEFAIGSLVYLKNSYEKMCLT